MKPLENKCFVIVHERGAGTRASAVAEIFVCAMRSIESIVVECDRALSDPLDL